MFDLNGTRLTLHEADEFNQPGPSGTVATRSGTCSACGSRPPDQPVPAGTSIGRTWSIYAASPTIGAWLKYW
jgi:hypothetical protein